MCDEKKSYSPDDIVFDDVVSDIVSDIVSDPVCDDVVSPVRSMTTEPKSPLCSPKLVLSHSPQKTYPDSPRYLGVTQGEKTSVPLPRFITPNEFLKSEFDCPSPLPMRRSRRVVPQITRRQKIRPEYPTQLSVLLELKEAVLAVKGALLAENQRRAQVDKQARIDRMDEMYRKMCDR